MGESAKLDEMFEEIKNVIKKYICQNENSSKKEKINKLLDNNLSLDKPKITEQVKKNSPNIISNKMLNVNNMSQIRLLKPLTIGEIAKKRTLDNYYNSITKKVMDLSSKQIMNSFKIANVNNDEINQEIKKLLKKQNIEMTIEKDYIHITW